MSRLDAESIRRSIGELTLARLAELEVFAQIESTNSYLMQQPGPEPGYLRVAVTNNQTAGRGRHGRVWQSPPGSGLCLSIAYTFELSPENLPGLTLATGLGSIAALKDLGIEGVDLKWPNDLIAMDGKLGGILTEALTQSSGPVTVVTGIGLNIDLTERLDFGLETDWARRIVDLKSHVGEPPSCEEIAASLIRNFHHTLIDYEAKGFSSFAARWAMHDWLFGREVTLDTPRRQVTGVGAGIADDGALLVDTVSDGTQRITTGSVVMAGIREYHQ